MAKNIREHWVPEMLPFTLVGTLKTPHVNFLFAFEHPLLIQTESAARGRERLLLVFDYVTLNPEDQ